jgi:hypothetical protein
MKEKEVLCRGSGFLIRAENSKFQHAAHFVTSSHVVAPWRWPRYYTDDWVQQLNESHTQYTFEIRDEEGNARSEFELLPIVYHHESRDLAVLHLADGDNVLQAFEEKGLLPDRILPKDSQPFEQGEVRQ